MIVYSYAHYIFNYKPTCIHDILLVGVSSLSVMLTNVPLAPPCGECLTAEYNFITCSVTMYN